MNNNVFAQNYNVNVLPSRVTYDKENGLNLFLLFKYVELERKLNKNYSVNLGIYYAYQKEHYALSYYKFSYYNINPNIRYYFNKKHNMSGFYSGVGLNYAHSNSKNEGREASLDGNISNNRIKYDFISLNVNTGYKLVLINNRFSIDLKLNQQLNLFGNKKEQNVYADGKIENFRNNAQIQRLPYPFLDLKLGYRFGFKK